MEWLNAELKFIEHMQKHISIASKSMIIISNNNQIYKLLVFKANKSIEIKLKAFKIRMHIHWDSDLCLSYYLLIQLNLWTDSHINLYKFNRQ